ncbi:MAG: hypothetical protein K2I14_08815 [Eubacterium sp.]|nr:hypothetical protein [Eubacterium sp.]
MKSATQKHSGFLPMLKNIFRRNALSLVLSQLITLFITLIITTGRLSKKPSRVEDITLDFSFDVSTTLAVFSFVISLIAVYILHRELFSRRASDFLLSMPVKREAFFNANAFFGLINIALSYVISFAAAVFLIKADVVYPAKFYIFDVSSFALLMLMSFLASIAVFSMFMVCAVISGRKWHYFVLSYFAASGAFSASAGLSNYVNTIWGFMLDDDYSFIVSTVASVTVSAEDKLNNVFIIVIALLAQTVIAYTAGIIAFKHRKAEVAETTVFGNILPFAIITVFLLAEAFMALSLANQLSIKLIAAFIAMVLSVLIITALFYRKPFNKLTIASLITSVAVTVVVVLCVEITPRSTGYVDYVPKASEVESVTVETGGDYRNMPGLDIFSDFLLNTYYDGIGFYSEDSNKFELASDEAKTAVSALHKKIASNEAQSRFYDTKTYEYDAVNGIRLEYKLKNGKTVVRTYSVNASIASEAFAAVLKTDECLEQIVPVSRSNDILFIAINNYTEDTEIVYEDTDFDDNDYDFVYSYNCIQLDDYKPLFDCIKKDIKKRENTYNFLMDNGFDSEYYEKSNEDYGYYDVYEDSVYTITFYRFNASVSDEEKENLLKITPNEMLSYNEKRMVESNYMLDSLFDEYIFIVEKDDNNTVRYLKSIE